MNRVLVSVQIDAPASRVWDVVGATAIIADWHPMLETSAQNGDVRQCTLQGGGVLKERILSHDAAGMTYSYAITEAPMPVSDYVGRMSVRAVTATRCSIEWMATFTAAPGADEAMVDLATTIMTNGFAGLAAKVA